MTVEEVIQQLQKYPFHYKVKAFARGVEIDDFYNHVVGVDVDVVTKDVLIEFDPTPTNHFPH